ncbi:MAG: DUF4325 domain-containing protein [Alphaproteobacteria bacterium]|nr:DUF4325 domain-containing protein [Alphaproteobacteria bacterium]
MKKNTRENKEIREYILSHIENHSADIGSKIIATFGISRAAASGYLQRLVKQGLLQAKGNTRARRYKLKSIVDKVFSINLKGTYGTGSEDAVWRERVLPLMKDVKKNIVDICQYCFTEMLNNAIDHSVSDDAVITYEQFHNRIKMRVMDHGVGIFEKIKNDFRLADARMALLELTKGKLTSDTKNHSGVGIFFTSRMLDTFHIGSGHLDYIRTRYDADDWLFETHDVAKFRKGTAITMEIDMTTDRTTRSVFEKYQGGNLISFHKTHVPIKLAQYPGEKLVSRSQAKSILARFEDFTEVYLDFEGVEEIGQAFADQIFRIFKNDHPDVTIVATHTTLAIDRMIAYVQHSESKAQS